MAPCVKRADTFFHNRGSEVVKKMAKSSAEGHRAGVER